MKLLYISANPKTEDESVCKTAARRFINKCKDADCNLEIEEMDLYAEDIPEVDFGVFTHRATIKQPNPYEELTPEALAKINRINFLCEQFLSADRYVIATPMWSLLFPGRLKNYIDCIIQNNKTIAISESQPKGLLDDKDRRMVYIQSSGCKYSGLITSRFDYGTDYMTMLFKFLGVKCFKNIPIDGTGLNNQGVASAMLKAEDEMNVVLQSFMYQE